MAEKAKKGTRGSKSRARRTAPKTSRRGAAVEDRGSIALRRSTSEYRAAAAEQAARVREEIEAALVQARSTREAIEHRIAEQLHAPARSTQSRARSKRAGGRASRK